MLLRHQSFRMLCRARDLLTEVGDETPTIAQLAGQIGISPFHFIRQFESVFGMTPHQFRIQSRLEKAKLLLANGGHSVTDVCMEIGFSSLGSFSDLFMRRVGVSPSTYRRHARMAVSVPSNYPQLLFPGCLSLMTLLPALAFRNFQEASSSAAH